VTQKKKEPNVNKGISYIQKCLTLKHHNNLQQRMSKAKERETERRIKENMSHQKKTGMRGACQHVQMEMYGKLGIHIYGLKLHIPVTFKPKLEFESPKENGEESP
jgi:hypothetical protein